MKKTIALVLTLVMVLGLCGCQSIRGLELPPLPQVTDTPAETAAPSAEPTETPAPQKSPEQRVILSVKNTLKKEYDPENSIKLILSFSYDTPTVVIDGNPQAASAINEYCARIEELDYTGEGYGDGPGTGFNNLLTLAQDIYTYYTQANVQDANYLVEYSCAVSSPRIDDNVLSLLYSYYTYTGGAHGMYCDRGYCFDTVTGDVLTLDTISSDRETLTAALKDAMVETVQTDVEVAERIDLSIIENEDYAAALEKIIRDGSWYFTDEGMVLFSDLYEISSYAAGPVSFVIPYEKLQGVIDSRFIPADNTASGTVSVLSEDELTGDSPIIDKLTVSKTGTQVFLKAEGEVRDVNISAVDFVESFYETHQLWYASCMKDEMLQIQTDIPDGMPNLKLSYRDSDGVRSFYLTQSGEDGSLILMDGESINAVG